MQFFDGDMKNTGDDDPSEQTNLVPVANIGELVQGFNTFQPEEIEEKRIIGFKDALILMRKINDRFNDNGLHLPFLGALDMLRKGAMSSDDVDKVLRKAKELFVGHDDLYEEFVHFSPRASIIDFLGHHERSAARREERISRIPLTRHDSGDYKIRHIEKNVRQDRDCDKDNNYLDTLKRKRKPSQKVLDSVVKDVRQDRDREKALERDNNYLDSLKRKRRPSQKVLDSIVPLQQEDASVASLHKGVASRKCSLLTKKEKFVTSKPVSHLGISNCQRVTPSYIYFPTPPASGRTAIDASVLNDVWKSKDCRSRNKPKHPLRDRDEEILSRIEDDRFELDMLLEKLKATANRVERFLEKLDGKIIRPDQIRLEDHISSSSLMFIEHLYSDYGLEVTGILRNDPCKILPAILYRLKQKQEELSTYHSESNKVWDAMYSWISSNMTQS